MKKRKNLKLVIVKAVSFFFIKPLWGASSDYIQAEMLDIGILQLKVHNTQMGLPPTPLQWICSKCCNLLVKYYLIFTTFLSRNTCNKILTNKFWRNIYLPIFVAISKMRCCFCYSLIWTYFLIDYEFWNWLWRTLGMTRIIK